MDLPRHLRAVRSSGVKQSVANVVVASARRCRVRGSQLQRDQRTDWDEAAEQAADVLDAEAQVRLLGGGAVGLAVRVERRRRGRLALRAAALTGRVGIVQFGNETKKQPFQVVIDNVSVIEQ